MPVMGHAYAEQDGKPQRVTPATVSLGLAVDVERKDGTRSLVVPVLRDASELSFADFVARYDELVVGARDNTLQPDAYQGANITLTNPGGIGTVASVPRLMPGQGTIVATGAIGYPPGLTAADPAQARGARRAEGHDDDLDLRPPRDPGRGVGRVPAPHRPAAPGRGRLLRHGLRGDGRDPERRGRRARPVTAAEPVPAAASPAAAPVADAALLQAVQAATSLVKAHRMHGHLAARLDPLGSEPVRRPGARAGHGRA